MVIAALISTVLAGVKVSGDDYTQEYANDMLDCWDTNDDRQLNSTEIQAMLIA